MKKSILLILLVSMVLVPSVYATVLLDDTWADGTRDDTHLPDESAFWVGHPDMVTMGTGSLAYGPIGSSSEKMWTYFTGNGSPASLSVGQQLVATIKFVPTGLNSNTTSKNFRFGLFNDPTDSQILEDRNDDGGGTGDLGQDDPWTDSTGYAVMINLNTGTAGSMQLGKRTDQTNSSLLGSTGAYTLDESNGKCSDLTDGTLYTVSMELDYQAANAMLMTVTFSDAGGVIAQDSYLDDGTLGGDPIWTDYDQLFFRLSKADGVAETLDFRELKVELVPEPATLALLGLGSLVSLRKRR